MSSRQTHPAASRASLSRRTTGFLAAAAALWATVGPIPGHPAEAVPGPAYDALRAEIPQLLTPLDAAHYRAVFRLQEQGRWEEADARIGEIYDPLLLGHVLHQRYLHPTAYKSSFEELRDWMEVYGDHPGAQRIHQLAQQRRPAAAPEPRAPFFTFEGAPAEHQASPPGPAPLSVDQASLVAGINSLINEGRLKAAEDELSSPTAKLFLPPSAYDRVRAELAMAHFVQGNDATAYSLAAAGAERSRDTVSIGHWIAGLAAFRMGNPYAAVLHFEEHALSPAADDWNVSAGAYWAARMHLQLRQPKWVDRWLRVAAEKKRTFYGLLARRALGMQSELDWGGPLLTGADVDRVLALPAGRRAVALAQIGETVRAETELQAYIWKMDSQHVRSLLAVADALNLPRTAARTGERLLQLGAAGRDRALYPLPPWKPDGGFRVDRALVYAFMRQESLFDAMATSPVGARGLMQLMPRTAQSIHDIPGEVQANVDVLFDPHLNIALGQRFLSRLLSRSEVSGDLFKLGVAYNAGLGNLRKWLRNGRFEHDPLLFIESLPARETRIFIERVMANLWIYRQRMGQPTPSLDAVVAGEWPRYRAFDESDLMVAEDVRH